MHTCTVSEDVALVDYPSHQDFGRIGAELHDNDNDEREQGNDSNWR